MTELSTPAEVIDVLGGQQAVADLTGKSTEAVRKWQSSFPSKTYLVLKAALEAQGYTAPPSLWNMVEPAQ